MDVTARWYFTDRVKRCGTFFPFGSSYPSPACKTHDASYSKESGREMAQRLLIREAFEEESPTSSLLEHAMQDCDPVGAFQPPEVIYET